MSKGEVVPGGDGVDGLGQGEQVAGGELRCWSTDWPDLAITVQLLQGRLNRALRSPTPGHEAHHRLPVETTVTDRVCQRFALREVQATQMPGGMRLLGAKRLFHQAVGLKFLPPLELNRLDLRERAGRVGHQLRPSGDQVDGHRRLALELGFGDPEHGGKRGKTEDATLTAKRSNAEKLFQPVGSGPSF